jgi:general L-amino acid transport system permease protein
VRHIVLPQALHTVIPVFTNEAIGPSKDTSLLMIVGMHETLSMDTLVMSNPDFLGTQCELFYFASIIFWIVTYAISHSGRRVERVQRLARR